LNVTFFPEYLKKNKFYTCTAAEYKTVPQDAQHLSSRVV